MPVVVTLVKEAPEGAVAVEAVGTEAFADHPLHRYLDDQGFAAKAGEQRVVPGAGGEPTIVVGLGGADRTVDDFRKVGGAIARAASTYETVTTSVLDAVGDLGPADCAQALAEGIGLGTYRYTVLKSDPKPSKLAEVHVVGKGGKRVQTALDTGSAVAEAVSVARDLVNEPGGTLTAPAFATEVESLAETYGFEVTVLGKKDIEKAKMGGVLGVNRGSTIEPRFLELRWAPSNPRGVVAIVGKGVTFDSGGLSLKPTEGMLTMKGDMGGGAAVVGTFCGLAAVNPRVEVRGYVPLTDNMTGGDATRLGDVLKISNGKTVEVHNTDAEGRLILADALSRASAAEPDAIVDLATLTGACMVALGQDHAGVFGWHEAWVEQVLAAGVAAGERSWRLPLPKDWRSQLDSDVADMKNIGSRYGGASTAALFLSEFVGDDIPWAHIDIAGPSFADSDTVLHRKGGTGYGVRTVLALLKGFKKPR